jgi:CheY-like chemotaxis protein
MTNEPLLMIVDDDEFEREMIKQALLNAECNCEMLEFADGAEVIDFFEGDDTASAKLILLDLNMPRATGMDVLRFLKGNSRYDDIIKVIFSTSNSENDMTQSKELGAHRYFVKPSFATGYTEMATEVKKYIEDTIL